ncbi:unnamed protein product [Heterobilharzia americana]|nr:unnamed protein product [Heterobilharzia americana]
MNDTFIFFYFRSTDDQFKLKLAQKKSALIELTSNSGRMIIGLFTTIIIGHISDLYGRRIALGILLIGEIFHIGITSLIILFEWNPWFIFIPGIFEAVFGGGLLCIFAIVAAILVDVVQLTNNDDDINNNSNSGIISHEKKKTYDQKLWILFTIFDSISSLSASFSSPVSGIIIYTYGLKASVIAYVSLFIPSLILIFILPETNKNRKTLFKQNGTSQENIPHMKKQSMTINENNKTSDVYQIDIEIKYKWSDKFKTYHGILKYLDGFTITLGFIVMLGTIAILTDLQYVVVYLMGSPFLWNPQQVGIYVGLTDFISAILAVTFTVVVVKIQQRQQRNENQDYKICHHGGVEKHSKPYMRQ